MPTRCSTIAEGPMLPEPKGRRPLSPGRRWLRAVLLLAACGVAVPAAGRPLLTWLAFRFRVNDPAPSDALLVLRGGHEPVELYRRGWAREVLMVPFDLIPFPDLNPFEVAHQVLIRRGIPAQAIRILDPVALGGDDREIAVRVREELQRRPVRRITIAALSSRTARLRRLYRRVLRDLDVDVRMAAVRSPAFDESNWYRKDEGLVEYFSEVLAMIRDALRRG